MLRIALDSVRGCTNRYVLFDRLILATPLDITRRLLQPIDFTASTLLPSDASSAILATFCWPADSAKIFTLPQGFGFLVAPQSSAPAQESSSGPSTLNPGPSLLAATFVHQKFPHRAPAGAAVIRAFFGSEGANQLTRSTDAEIAAAALAQLREILGPLPDPAVEFTTVRRWPRSLPQYEVGHLDRMAQLHERLEDISYLSLLGNSYRGVGLPDLIRDARAAARSLIEQISTARIR
jgi:oxygen-dependent protoporphyrinogen oxidase